MKVAPFESCVACMRGDVATAVHFEGEAEFIIAGISHFAELSEREASETFRTATGSDPGQVPVGRMHMAVRLCKNCARKTGAHVAPASPAEGDNVFTYVEPVPESGTN